MAEQAAEAARTLPTDDLREDDLESQQLGTSQKSERISSSSPLFRQVQRANGLHIDVMGDNIPAEVQALVNKHFRKVRNISTLSEPKVNKIRESIKRKWHDAEPTLSTMLTASLFATSDDLHSGGDTVWNGHALPRNPGAYYQIPPPKTDYHLGFSTTLGSNWNIEELDIADHPVMRPYSQPASENMFPSYLREVKSKARGGTLYAAEGQLASAGAHRIASWLWALDQLDPNRVRSCADAIVFSDAVTQRQVIAYVHSYNPDDKLFYMSCIDQFYFRDDILKCRDHMENVAE